MGDPCYRRHWSPQQCRLTGRSWPNRILLAFGCGRPPQMGFTDVLLLMIRWLHGLAAVAWVGGGLFYLLVVRPGLSSGGVDPHQAARRLGEEFRHLVNTAIAVLLVTGVILTLSRLTSDYGGLPYIAVLSIKVALSLYMFYLVRFLRPRTYPDDVPAGRTAVQRVTALMTGATAVLVLGVLVFLLADILHVLVERGLKG